MEKHHWFDIRLVDENTSLQLEQIKDSLVQKRKLFDLAFEEKHRKLSQGDELPPGVQKMVKVYIAVKEDCSLAIRWLVDMETKVLFPRLYR